MIDKPIKSYLASANLPFTVTRVKPYGDYTLVLDQQNKTYVCTTATEQEYATYLDLLKYSKRLSKTIYETKVDGGILLFFDYDSMTDSTVRTRQIFSILAELHEASSFEITLKKEHLVNLNNIYKVLDNKFSYLELRIREIETSPKKDDVSWIILSKYNIILDAKLYLYDLQTDIFKAIDQKQMVKYGLIYRKIYPEFYNRQHLLPSFDIYYGPISMLYCRCFLQLDELDLKDSLKKLDSFNQKYFCFMTLYILILNVNLEVILNTYSVASYISITKKIRCFLASYKEIMEKQRNLLLFFEEISKGILKVKYYNIASYDEGDCC